MNQSILLDTIQGKPHSRPPVWFMRQAGRTLPFYQQLRKKYGFKDIMTNPELASRVTLEPVEELGVDGAIIFTDILIVPEAMGMETTFDAGGPKLGFSLQDTDEPTKLLFSNTEKFEPVAETIKEVRKNKPGDVPVIGFSGAPYTVLCYMLEGKSSRNNFFNVARYMYEKPEAVHRLMKTITDMTITYANTQIDAGIDIFQVFDTHAGSLPYPFYAEFCLPYVQKIIQAVRKRNIPVIFFPKGIGVGYSQIDSSLTDYLSIDWQTPIAEISKNKDPKLGLQGNIDPRLLLADQEQIAQRLEEYVELGSRDKSWIFNLGHGIQPDTPLENIKFVVDWVKTTDWKRG